MSTFIEKRQGLVNTSPVDYRLESIARGQRDASPGEIVEAKIDGVCPRCGRELYEPDDGADCVCGFSY